MLDEVEAGVEVARCDAGSFSGEKILAPKMSAIAAPTISGNKYVAFLGINEKSSPETKILDTRGA